MPILHLYKQAGFERLLLGTENTDQATLVKIAKGSSTATDREAIRLLRRHGILSLATFVVGFEEGTDGDYWRALRQLRPAMRWYTGFGWRVWPVEIWNFLFREHRVRKVPGQK